MRRRQHGFTFIELMVVIVVIGLGTVIAIPMIEGGFDSREVKRAALQMRSMMIHCRGEAVALGTPQALVIDVPKNAVYQSGGGRWEVLSDRAAIDRVQGGQDLGPGVVRFLFFPNGSSSGGRVAIGSRRDRARDRWWLTLDPLIGGVTVDTGPA